MQNVSKIIKGFLLALVVAGLSFALVVLDQEAGQETGLTGAIITPSGNTGTPGDGWSPLESTTACTDRQTQRLQVNGDPAAYDWSVTPTGYDILQNPADGTVADEHLGAGKIMNVVAPTDEDLSTIPDTFTVSVAPDTGFSGVTFVVKVSPSCVEKLDFLQPSPAQPIVPQDGQIQIEQIRATLENGMTYTYDSSYFGNLELRFIRDRGTTNEKQVSSVVELPIEHAEVTIDMEVSGDNVPPVHVPPSPGTYDQPTLAGGQYELNSDRVNPDSIVVFENDGGSPGNYLEPNVDWNFVNLAPDADSNTNDAIRLIGAYSGDIQVAYAYASDDSIYATTPLTVEATSCETLQTGIYQGRGQGFAVEDPTVTAGSGSISENFDFATAPESIILRNPLSVGSTAGKQDFQLIFSFDAGLENRAELINESGNIYEIAVREGSPEQTASNFAYAINNTLGVSSPFIAYIDPTDRNDIILYSLEIGSHTNDYECSVDEVAIPACFTGGSDASGGNVITDPPRPLDPVIQQGETRLIYTKGGVGAISWRSSDESIISIDPVSEAINEEEQLGNENIIFTASVQKSDFDLPTSGYISASNCEYDEVGDSEAQIVDSCEIEINAPVTFNFPSVGYPITILPEVGNPITGTIQGTSMVGTLTGTATIDAQTGGVVQATGTLNGSVTGAAIGGVKADITMNVNLSNFTSPKASDLELEVTSISLTGTLSKTDSLVPTQRTLESGTVTSTFALITAKKPGQAIIFANDNTGCTVPFTVDVIESELEIDYETQPDDPIFEVGDEAQLTATYDSQDVSESVDWESSDSSIVAVDSVGKISAVGTGSATITGRYTVNESQAVSQFRVQVARVEGVTISLDRQTVSELGQAQRENAFVSAIVAVNREDAIGQSITLEGQTFEVEPITTATPTNERERIEAIVDQMEADFSTVADVTVTPHPTAAGVLALLPTGSNTAIDISTTANETDISILPSMANGIQLPRTGSYGLVALAEYSNGLTKRLSLADVNFEVTPVNRLDDTALDAGRLERGIEAGNASVTGVYERNDGITLRSNAIQTNVQLGPTLEYVRILGQEAITQGSRVSLNIKVNDDENVADIDNTQVWLVRSNANTYSAINEDTNAQWFDVQSFTSEVEVTEEGEEGETATAGVYKLLELPVEIPVNALLSDGAYKLIVEITDVDGRVARSVVPITIGEAASGDVTGDGQVNMIDVITAFRIVTGQITPTNAQLQAGNLDATPGISMIDVILLFRSITNPAN